MVRLAVPSGVSAEARSLSLRTAPKTPIEAELGPLRPHLTGRMWALC